MEQRNADRLALAAMVLAIVLIANDFSALGVALPSIESDFHTSLDTVQWVVNAYTVAFGVLIVTGGRLADMFGRRRTFFVGGLIFASMSALGGAAQGVGWLIATRALMGLGGALIWPSVLGLTFAILPREKAGLAGGLVVGAAGIGNTLGAVVGGLLTDLAGWRWLFFLNVPVALVAIGVAYLLVHTPEPEPEDHRIDYAGIATITLGLVALLVAFDQADSWGWGDPRVIGLLVLCLVMLTVFVAIERRSGRHALLPGTILRRPGFTSACVAILFGSSTFIASLVYLPQIMEKQLGYSPLHAGVGLLPVVGAFAVVSLLCGRLYARLGPRVPTILGTACVTLAAILLSLVGDGSGYGVLAVAMVVLGFGVGCFFPAATTVAVAAVDSSRSSLAGGVFHMFQMVGGAIGLGLTTTVFTASEPPFLDGFTDAFRINAALLLVALVVCVLFVGRGVPAGSTTKSARRRAYIAPSPPSRGRKGDDG